ncbi:MAG: M23 family metallopeptidase [Bacteroidaceae bacterium]|nr:M23 family metallopeptidase [Bacteroidaceae bacterium]
MRNKKKRKPWWQNIKFKYRLTIVNENTLEEVLTLYVSKLNGLSVLFSTLTILFLLTALLMIYTPLRNYLPGYMSNQLRSTIVNNTLQADSLDEILNRHHLYIQNIQDILAGKINSDSVQSIDSLTAIRTDELMAATEREEVFRKQYEEDERYNLTASDRTNKEAAGLDFFRPTRGILSSSFDPDQRHFGVDIAANPNESVLATLEGTVIWSSYTTKTGYVIALQHNRGLISIYKHCGSLLKKEGDHVRAGEAIALVGNSGTETTGPHLHFELWSKGTALNPERYIMF